MHTKSPVRCQLPSAVACLNVLWVFSVLNAQLASLIKSCRDIMRKDKGLNSDLDRLPMLTWIMFLKFLDDMEQMRGAVRIVKL
jgi:hypothetical protein